MTTSNQFEFGKFFDNPYQQTYLHIVQPITQIQIWRIALALLAVFLEGCAVVNHCSDTVSQWPGGFLMVKVARLVYEQVIFKLSGWLSLYVLAGAAFCYYEFKEWLKPKPPPFGTLEKDKVV